MALRDEFMAAMKDSMKAGTAARTSTLRMIMAKLKDAEIAARTGNGGVTLGNPIHHPEAGLSDEQVTAVLRGMVKSRRESVALYEQGNRPELAAKEQDEIAVIEGFLPQAMDEAALDQAVAAAVAESGAAGPKDMGKVVAALKARLGAALDMGRAGPLVKAKLAALATAPG